MAVAVVLTVAFSPLFRTILWSPLRWALGFAVVHLQLYRLWLWLQSLGNKMFPEQRTAGLQSPSGQITQLVNSSIETMRKDVRRGRAVRAERESIRRDFPQEPKQNGKQKVAEPPV